MGRRRIYAIYFNGLDGYFALDGDGRALATMTGRNAGIMCHMRVLFVHQNFPGQFKHLAPRLAADGHEVVALSINKPSASVLGVKILLHCPRGFQEEVGGVKSIVLTEFRTKMLRGESVACSLLNLKQGGFTPDVIYAHSGWGEAYYIKDIFPDAKLLVYAEYFYQASGGDLHFDPEFSLPAESNLQRLHVKNMHLMQALVYADRGLSPTEFQRSRHPELLRSKIEVIHDGIDTSRFAPSTTAQITLRKAGVRLTADNEVVTFVSRELEPYRGYHIFMRALPELLARRPNAHVVIVGGNGTSYGAPPPTGATWREIFHAEVAGRIDRQRVHFVGKLPHVLLTELMQISTVHVYLTYPFVLSWSMMEAMSIGCMIVASDTAPVREQIRHKENGILVNFFDFQALADAIVDAIENRDERQSLRDAARAHIVARHDLASICLPAQLNLISRMAEAA